MIPNEIFFSSEERQPKSIGKIIKVNGEKEAVCLASTKIKCFLVRAFIGKVLAAGGLRWRFGVAL